MPSTPLQRPGRRRFQWFVAAILVLLSLYGCRTKILVELAAFLDVSERPRRVDYVMVLGGGIETRPYVAAALYRRGLARQILLASDELTPALKMGIVSSSAKIVKQIMAERQVPPAAVIQLVNRCRTTWDEANVLAQFLADKPASSVAVVTNCFHSRRARWTFRRVLGGSRHQIQFIGVPDERYKENNWWQSSNGVVACTMEYLKLVAYLFHYGAGDPFRHPM